MAKKIKNAIDWYFQRLVENPSKETKKDFNSKYNELADLIHNMWKNDLISDNVKSECYKVLEWYGWQSIKYSR